MCLIDLYSTIRHKFIWGITCKVSINYCDLPHDNIIYDISTFFVSALLDNSNYAMFTRDSTMNYFNNIVARR